MVEVDETKGNQMTKSRAREGQADAAVDTIVNVSPAAPAPPGHHPPKTANGLVEHGTAHGWMRRPAMVATARVQTRTKGPAEDEGKSYSMSLTEKEVEQYVAYLVKGSAILVMIWINGKFDTAICNKPLRKFNYTEVRAFIKGES